MRLAIGLRWATDPFVGLRSWLLEERRKIDRQGSAIKRETKRIGEQVRSLSLHDEDGVLVGFGLLDDLVQVVEENCEARSLLESFMPGKKLAAVRQALREIVALYQTVLVPHAKRMRVDTDQFLLGASLLHSQRFLSQHTEHVALVEVRDQFVVSGLPTSGFYDQDSESSSVVNRWLGAAIGGMILLIVVLIGLILKLNQTAWIGMLNVMVAIAAGLMASILTGRVRYRKKFPMIQASGGVAIFLIVFALKPLGSGVEELRLSIEERQEVQALVQNMETNYAARKWDVVRERANQILKVDTGNRFARNRLAAVEFSEGKFDTAIGIWNSLAEDYPQDKVVQHNLCFAYIDSDRASRAIPILKELCKAPGGWQFECDLARAHLYNKDYQGALDQARRVPDDKEEGNARIYEAAALVGLKGDEVDPNEVKRLIEKAKPYSPRPGYWAEVMQGDVDDRLSRKVEVKLLRRFFDP